MKRKNLEVMATFSHPLRVEIMRLLSARKMTVNELADELPLTSGGVRPHLSYFINRRLLHTKRNGRTVYYWLNRDRLVEALSELGAEAGIDVSLVKRWSVEEPRDVEPTRAKKTKRAKKTGKKASKAKRHGRATKKPPKKAAKKRSSRRKKKSPRR